MIRKTKIFWNHSDYVEKCYLPCGMFMKSPFQKKKIYLLVRIFLYILMSERFIVSINVHLSENISNYPKFFRQSVKNLLLFGIKDREQYWGPVETMYYLATMYLVGRIFNNNSKSVCFFSNHRQGVHNYVKFRPILELFNS